MVKKSLQIHSENILPIIKRWLYSDKDIFVRELVANSCDALYKVKILRDRGEAVVRDEELRIDIGIDKSKGTLTFSDTGLGMDTEEVEKYIAQIAFSSAEEFLQKYKSNQEGDQIIGHFGLGFYSSYMVAEKVEIDTLSYKQDAQSVFWSCGTSNEYEIGKGTRTERGTTITLFLAKDEDEYLEEGRIKEILDHYCAFLPYPVYLGDTLINPKEPLWIKTPSECTESDYLEFYRHLYPMQDDPLFWVHLNVDYPFHLKGILYFPKIKRDFDPNKNTIKLYCNRVFVSDSCKDVIPHYLTVLQGVIDSLDIPLNVSRSSLQMDRNVRQLSGHISKKVSDSLTSLFKSQREKFEKSWKDVAPVLKLGALEDEKFYDRVKDILIWKVIGDGFATLTEYLDRNREKTKDKVFYTSGETHLAHFVDLFRQKGIEVIAADHPIDSYLIHFLERKLAPVVFRRVDGSLDDVLLDKEREKIVLDPEGKTEAVRLADFVRSKLSKDDVTVEAKSLAHDALAAFVVIEEEQRRMRDYLMAVDPEADRSKLTRMGKQTFVVNTNHPLMGALQKLDRLNSHLSEEVVHELYDLSLLSQHEMDPESLKGFVARSTHVLEQLVLKALGQ